MKFQPQTERDLADLRTVGRLQPLAPVPPDERTPRNQIGVLLEGMLICGLVVGLPVFTIAAVLQGKATEGGSAIAQGVLVGAMWGLLFGVPASAVPGIFVGLYRQRRELNRRRQAQHQQILFARSQAREELRLRLERGQITAQEAARQLGEVLPDASYTEPLQAADSSPSPYPLPLPPAGQPLEPLEIMILASAAADRSGGYINVDHESGGTPATVLRILQHPYAEERTQIVMLRHNEIEAMEALAWAAQAPATDAYRQRVRAVLARGETDPHDRAAVTLVASAVGGWRRAKAVGLA